MPENVMHSGFTLVMSLFFLTSIPCTGQSSDQPDKEEKAEVSLDPRVEKLLGFQVAPLSAELAEKYRLADTLKGVVIVKIVHTSSAYRAGLREGDLMQTLGRWLVESVEQLNTHGKKYRKGQIALIRAVREERAFVVSFGL